MRSRSERFPRKKLTQRKVGWGDIQREVENWEILKGRKRS